ncbi:MAG: putative beta-glucosyl-HMC-alpha-glucosyl-transferase [Prokaryotic dsDNA virus sp.]|nr:MAG: putative beta-glucosyl-HMC-alpha-glucosyl-transferase [Prokaryotic dsDNA virus sp.]|tara:strand:- start:8627 stop:9376 length:750 start_codon:yes stop_codon:yes gene_type:complete
MNKEVIVCIGSKGRPKTKTYKLFEKLYKVYHFIEPQEFKKYDVPNMVNIKENDRGVSYMRNFVLKWCKKKKIKWIILADDDIVSFGKVINGKTKKTDASIWEDIYKKAKRLPFELVGINYRQYAWSEKNRISINTKFPDVCVLINIDALTWDFGDWLLKVDRNFTLETIKNGYGTMRFNHFFFSCPDVGTNEGGLQDLYKKQIDKEYAIKLAEKWKPHTKLIKKGKRIDTKVDIKAVAKQYGKKINEIR